MAMREQFNYLGRLLGSFFVFFPKKYRRCHVHGDERTIQYSDKSLLLFFIFLFEYRRCHVHSDEWVRVFRFQPTPGLPTHWHRAARYTCPPAIFEGTHLWYGHRTAGVCVCECGWMGGYLCTHVHIHVYTHARTHTHIHTHTYTHTHTHAHTHTHTQNKHSYTAIFTHIHALRCSIDVHNIKKISFIIEREYILTKFIEDKHSCTTISTNIHTLQYSIHIHYRTKISFMIEREHIFIFKHS